MRIQGAENFIPMQQEAKSKAVAQGTRNVKISEKNSPGTGTAGKEATDINGLRRLEEAVVLANKTMETYGTELRFSIHEGSGEYQVKVVDTRDNSVIREIPPERVLNFVAHIKKMLGIIIDKFI